MSNFGIAWSIVAALLIAPSARATSTVYTLAADTPKPVVIYAINATDGFSSASKSVFVYAESGSAEVERLGILNPFVRINAMQFHFPAAECDLTFGASAIPFHFSVAPLVEQVVDIAGGSLAEISLVNDGVIPTPIGTGQTFSRLGFDFSLASAGSILKPATGADCTSTGFPGCVNGRFEASVHQLQLMDFALIAGNATIRDPVFNLGSDGAGLTWSVGVTTRYPLEGTGSVVFVPEPSAALLLGSGIVAVCMMRFRRE